YPNAASIIAITNFDRDSENAPITQEKLKLINRLTIDSSKTLVLIVPSNPSNDALRSYERSIVPLGNRPLKTEDCRALWTACTTAEQAGLYDLAQGSWVNYRNKSAYDELLSRGLLSGLPFQITNPDFRTYILENVTAKERKAWAKEDAPGIW